MIFLALPDVEILDLAGPMQVFSEANRSRARYRMRTVSTRERIRTDQGLLLADLEPLPEVGEHDLIVVPGMPYPATLKFEAKTLEWLKMSYAAGAAVASVCTGAFLLGEAGLLDGRHCTTHWARMDELTARFPLARVLTDRLFVTDGRVTTSAGIASGIDMSLALIERAHGPLLTAEIAREMVVYLRRDGSHEQRSVYLDFRSHIHPGIHRVQDLIVHEPATRTPLAGLAKVAGMSTRNMTRAFRQMTGISIKEFTTRVRLEFARSLLHDPTLTLDAVARRCGFESARQLRRVWQTAYGKAPSEARASIGPQA